jgi:tetratricopeptide (TPR) repeat protein
MVGRTLSHFRITAKIGEGGMGIVYRAEDERLRRTVAIKILPPELTGREERRLRFLREAQAAAALNHPNICTIHEVDSHDGVDFLVMELLDGKTLRDHLGHRPLPPRTLLPIAVQIGEALAAAHEHGVLHRDLKPENIFITTQGTAKVLDFGLAKVLAPAPAQPDIHSRLDTLSRELTLQGKVFGTVAYMSPEQACGHATTHQSDLFAFGAVLYEMATGRQPFRGDSDAETLASIIKEEVMPAATLTPDLPSELDRIIGKCLEKDLADRYHHADELVADLRRLKRVTDSGVQAIRTPGAGVATAGAPTGVGAIRTTGLREVTARPARRRWLISGAVLIVVLAGAAAALWTLRPAGRMQPGDSVLVADFDNRTDRPEFDSAPRVVFESLLAGSGYLDVVWGARLDQLRAERAGDTASRIDQGLAERLCAGGGCTGFVLGSIAPDPPGYRIDVGLHRIGEQNPAATARTTAASDREIVAALHAAAVELREAVGESPAALANAHPPATRSLEALRILATAGAIHESNPREELTLLERAIQVDPGFADAYEQAAVALQNLGEWGKSRRFADEAYRLSAGLPEQVRLLREILVLDVRYDVHREVELLRSYRRLYPLEPTGANWLGFMLLAALHDPAGAEPHFRDAFRIRGGLIDFELLCDSLARQGKVGEIEAIGKTIRNPALRNDATLLVEYHTAVARRDRMAAEKAADRFGPESFGGPIGAFDRRTSTRLVAGKFAEARRTAQAGIEAALRTNASPVDHFWTGIPHAWLSWRRTGSPPILPPPLIDAARGNLLFLRNLCLFAEDTGSAGPLRAVLATHEEVEAGSTSRLVEDTLRMARATLALIEARHDEARVALEPLAPSSRDPVVHHLLARAYDALGLPGRAAVEYEESVRLASTGYATPASVLVLDRFRLAQAHERAGEAERARQVYAQFVEFWNDADSDIPELVAVRARLTALGGPPAAVSQTPAN